MTETSRPEPYSPSPVPSGDGGRASIILAGITVLLGLVGQVVGQLLPLIMRSLALGVDEITLVFLPIQLLTAIAAVLAIVFAIRPLSGQGPKALAGAGAGIGAATLLSLIVGLVLPPLLFWMM